MNGQMDGWVSGLPVCCGIAGVVCHGLWLGCGLNVKNSNPTICVNDIVEIYNRSKGLKLGKLSVELTLAQMLNTLELLLDQLDKEGISPLVALYHKYWIHRFDTTLSQFWCRAVVADLIFQWEQSSSSNR